MKRSIARLLAAMLALFMLLSAAGFAATAQQICPVCGQRSFNPSAECRDATCSQEGRICGWCGNCPTSPTQRYNVDLSVPKLKHDWGKWIVTKDATCAHEGSRYHVCNTCGTKKTDSIDRLAHSWGDWTVVTEPTDCAAGVREHTCKVCKSVRQEEFYPDGTLMQGDRGDEVEALQKALNKTDHNCGAADGIFGKKTAAAVSEFEEENGMNPDGIAWPKVRAMLKQSADASAPSLTRALAAPANLFEEYQQTVGYALGEIVPITVTFTNNADEAAVRYLIIGDTTSPETDYIHEYSAADLAPHDSIVIHDDYEVTAHDIEQGYVDSYGWADSTNSDDAEYYVTVDPAQIPVRVDDYADEGALTLSVTLLDGGEAPLTAGNLVHYSFELVNNTEEPMRVAMLRHSSERSLDGNVYPDPYVLDFYDEQLDPVIAPHESLTDTFGVILSENDAGADSVLQRFIAASPAADGHWRWSNTVDIRLPQETDEGKGGLYLEFVTDPSELVASAEGEALPVTIRATNVGSTVLTMNAHAIHDGNGSFVSADEVTYTGPEDPEPYYSLFGAGQSLEFVYTIHVTADDVASGAVVRSLQEFAESWIDSATGKYYVFEEAQQGDLVSDEITIASNVLDLEIPVVALRAFATSESDVTFTKEAFLYNEADDTVSVLPEEGVREGDMLMYVITLNTVTTDLLDVEVSDFMKGNNEDAIFDHIEIVSPIHCPMDFSFYYTVTAEDAARGYVSNIAHVMYLDASTDSWVNMDSNECVVPIYTPTVTREPEPESESSVELTKTVVSAPENGIFYGTGETVEFEITVTNGTNHTFANASIGDHLEENRDPIQTYKVMEPGFSDVISYNYVVTEADAALGSITNVASFHGIDENDSLTYALSDPVNVPCGNPDAPFGVITELTVAKEVTNAPANGVYFTEGEVIQYQITYTNTGETPLGETVIYDTLKSGGEIASAEHLYVGESRACTFEHTVTAKDVEKGYVVNLAYAEYDVSGTINTAISNEVVSDTDGEPDVFDGNGSLELIAVNELPCIRAILSREVGEARYEVSYCAKHAATQERVKALLTAAEAEGTDEALLTAWQTASEMWMSDLDALFATLMEAADPAAQVILLNERTLFGAQVSCHEQALAAMMPDQPLTVAQEMAEMWMNKVVDLCYAMHTAPDARADSLLNVDCGNEPVSIVEDCARAVEPQENGSVRYAEILCGNHVPVSDVTNAILAAEPDPTAAWSRVADLWLAQMQNAYRIALLRADDADQTAIVADQQSFIHWLNARAALLHVFYADEPAVVAEMTAKAYMNRALDLCAGALD